MMDKAAVNKAAALLIRARRSRQPLERLPEDCRPALLADALRIQAATVEQLADRAAGWKVGGPIDGELSYGALLASRIVHSGGTIDARDMPLLGMEAEIAFRLLRDAPPRDAPYTYEEIAGRVIAFPAIEIVATRYRDYKGTPLIERVADCMSNGAFVIGDDRPAWRSLELIHIPVSLAFGDDVIIRSVGGHVAGDPLRPAVELVNALRAGAGMHAGDLITTGTYTGLHFAAPGVRVRAAFEGLGEVEIEVR